jgi:hypothetical protein
VVQVFDAVRLLDKTCVRPQTGEPYIKSIKAGKNTLQVPVWIPSSEYVLSLTLLSLSLVQGGHITHAFVFEFENAEDLAYYGDIDPVSTSDPSAYTFRYSQLSRRTRR